jgi:hypothetical protein
MPGVHRRTAAEIAGQYPSKRPGGDMASRLIV